MSEEDLKRLKGLDEKIILSTDYEILSHLVSIWELKEKIKDIGDYHDHTDPKNDIFIGMDGSINHFFGSIYEKICKAIDTSSFPLS